MKNLKDILNEAYLLEDFFGNVGSTPEDNKRRKFPLLIEAWLKKYNIEYYTINKDLTIDVNSDVNLNNYPEKEFPEYIQFGKVYGSFLCDHSKLKSLKGAPKEISGCFYCSNCGELKTLEGSPEKVGGDFICSGCNNLKTLEGAPMEIRWSFVCSRCKKLTSIGSSLKKINKNFYYDNCPSLKEDPNIILKNIVKGIIIK